MAMKRRDPASVGNPILEGGGGRGIGGGPTTSGRSPFTDWFKKKPNGKPATPKQTKPKRTRKKRRDDACKGKCREFRDFKDHADRHGGDAGMNRDQYRASAEAHVSPGGSQWKGRFRHNGQTKMGHISKMGPNKYIFSSTTLSGRRIMTHMPEGVTMRYIRGNGITLPKGF